MENKSQNVVIDAAGRLVLPAWARKKLHLSNGACLKLTLVGDVLELKPMTEGAGIVKKGNLYVYRTNSKNTLSLNAVENVRQQIYTDRGHENIGSEFLAKINNKKTKKKN